MKCPSSLSEDGSLDDYAASRAFAGPELVSVISFGRLVLGCTPHILLLKGRQCISVLGEQDIYDVMIGLGLMIVNFA